MEESKNKRYPGARPFKNDPVDRKLFFGRESEKKRLLHLILSNNMVVLFAKSGVGKSSLLNAGVFEALQDRQYFPVSIRHNDTSLKTVENVKAHIEKTAESMNVEFIPGNDESLWEFLKTSELWSADDKLLTPVLVFDQFEEIFTLGYTEDQRREFFNNLAELGKGKYKSRKDKDGKPIEFYKQNPPKVKIILSLREEFLANLEEIAERIPSVLNNRFRLSAMTEQQAIDAIKKPAAISDDLFSSRKFNYSDDAISSVTSFLMKKDLKERMKVMTNNTRWPSWILIVYGVLMIIPFLIANKLMETNRYGGYDLMTPLFIAWIIIPLFFIFLSIRKPIPTRNALGSVLLFYGWSFLLCAFWYPQNDTDLRMLFFFIPALLTFLIVLGICSAFWKGRLKMFDSDDQTQLHADIKGNKWSWKSKPFTYLYALFPLIFYLEYLFRLDFTYILGASLALLLFYIVHFVRKPVPFKNTLLPLLVGCFLFSMVSVLLPYLDIQYFLVVFVISSISLIAIIAIFSWNFFRGMKSVDLSKLKEVVHAKEKIEPFQLQLLCQNIEEKVLQKQENLNTDITITEADFGGDAGMRRILKKFYADQLSKIKWIKRGKVRNLIEKGLISQSGRRLSLAQDDIESRFKIKKDILSQLINYRILRSEQRGNGDYYEISHDTLLQPILTSSKKRIQRNSIISWGSTFVGFLLLVFLYNFYQTMTYPKSQDLFLEIKERLASDEHTVKQKIAFIEPKIQNLEARKNLNFLKRRESENAISREKTDLADYKASLSNLKDVDSLSFKIERVYLANDKTSAHGEFRIKPNLAYLYVLRDDRTDLDDNASLISHNLVIEHYMDSKSSLEKKLIKVIRLDAIAEDQIIELNYFSPVLVEGRNHFKIYEVDSFDEKYLLEDISFNLWLGTEKEFEAKLENDPQNSLVHTYLGYLKLRNTYGSKGKRYEEGINHLDTALKLNSRNAIAYYWRAKFSKASRSEKQIQDDYMASYFYDNTLWLSLDNLIKYPDNLVSNGSFEYPEVPDIDHFLTGELSNDPDDVFVGNVWENYQGANFELKSSLSGLGNAFHGTQYVELAGRFSASIKQKLYTEKGKEYILSFAYSPYPGTKWKDNRMNVTFNGENIDFIAFDGSINKTANWETFYYPIVASSDSSYLEFSNVLSGSRVDDEFGPLLDAVIFVERGNAFSLFNEEEELDVELNK